MRRIIFLPLVAAGLVAAGCSDTPNNDEHKDARTDRSEGWPEAGDADAAGTEAEAESEGDRVDADGADESRDGRADADKDASGGRVTDSFMDRDVVVEDDGRSDGDNEAADDGGREGGAVCVEETNAAFCARNGKTCGSVMAADNCGRIRTVASCGECPRTETCGTQNVCDPCVPDEDDAFCSRNGKNCGKVTGIDNCEKPRTVSSCGTCTPPLACGGANYCCVAEPDTAFCARQNKNCGDVTGTDNCGVTRTAKSCGTCRNDETCGVERVCLIRSCDELASTCGAGKKDSCCASSLVPGGTFYRGVDNLDHEDKSFPATVSDFRLDTYEVTVGRFRKFVAGYPGNKPAAGTGKNPNNSADPGWDAAWDGKLPADRAALVAGLSCDSRKTLTTWTDTPGDGENRPINCVSWYVAYAFCIWDGGRLPTEAEWEYAAAGGSEQRVFPWSAPPTRSTIDDALAVYCGGSCGTLPSVGSKAPRGNGRWGHADLAGSLEEWTLDNFAAYTTPCKDCSGPATGAERAVRGGSFGATKWQVSSARRASAGPDSQAIRGGIRCARKP